MSEATDALDRLPSLEDIRLRHVELLQQVAQFVDPDDSPVDEGDLRQQLLTFFDDIRSAGRRTITVSRYHELVAIARHWQSMFSIVFKESMIIAVAERASEQMTPAELTATQRDAALAILRLAKEAQFPAKVMAQLAYAVASFR